MSKPKQTARWETICEGPGYRFVGVENVLLTLYWGTPDVRPLRRRIPWIERTIREYGSFGLLVVVYEEATGTLPGKAFRDERLAQTERFFDHYDFVVCVIEGEGVVRSLLRTSLRGLNVVVRRGLLSRFFATVEVAAGFVGEHSKADAQQLRDAIRAHRPSRVPPPRPSISL